MLMPPQLQPVSVSGPVAVIDIGSNSVRLVAYDRLSRAPVPTFNEKSLCGLGREVAATGMLPADGLERAFAALRRFRVLCDVMRIERLFVLATAAARRAKNGPAFIEEVKAILRTDVAILSGAEEAHLAACGVLAGLNRPNGLAGDLGGGSLELIDVRDGRVGEGFSLELGGLALRDTAGKSLKRAARIVTDALESVPAIIGAKDRDILAIGGTWRAIARLHMARTGYPLNVLHGYSVEAGRMIDFCRELQRVEIESLPAIAGVARERRPLVAYGALVLEHLLRISNAARFMVSASGVREGILLANLPGAQRVLDPLLVGARALNDLHARDAGHADELIAWTDHFAASLPAAETADQRRVRHAACLVAEVAWRANPDYRAEEAARVVAYAALPAIGHRDRAFLASAMHARYEGLVETVVPPLRALLTATEIDQARALGCLLRIGFNISAGQSGILPHTPVLVERGSIIQMLPGRFADLNNERLLGRIKQAAKVLGLDYSVRIAAARNV